MNLDDIYRQRCDNWSDIYEHLPFMHDLAVKRDAKVVVELGVRSGNSTAAFLTAVKKTGGHLWSVDATQPLWPAEFWQSGLVTFIHGDDLAVADRVPADIDVLFVDSSHHYKHTLAELRLYGPRSKTIILHDTELERPEKMPRTDPKFPVKAAVEAWTAEVSRRWENKVNCYGLGVIHPKPAPKPKSKPASKPKSEPAAGDATDKNPSNQSGGTLPVEPEQPQ